MYTIVMIFCLIIAVPLMYIILGRFPKFKGTSLSEEDITRIKNNGILHKTSEAGLEGIKIDKIIKGSSGLTAYTNSCKKTAHFFVCKQINTRNQLYNNNYKYRHTITIKNLSNDQISRMKIRRFDNVLLYSGDFKYENINKIIYKEENFKVSPKEYFSWAHIKFIVSTIYYFIISYIIANLILLMLIAILYLLFINISMLL